MGEQKNRFRLVIVLLLGLLVGLAWFLAREPDQSSRSSSSSSKQREEPVFDGKAIFEVEGSEFSFDPATSESVFSVPTWPQPEEINRPLQVLPFQVGDFVHHKIEELQELAGFGWFDDGQKIWMAQTDGLIRIATFPGLVLQRELSFQGLKVRNLPGKRQDPDFESYYAIRELGFHAADSSGERLIALFASDDPSRTHMLQIDLPTLVVQQAGSIPDAIDDTVILDDGTIALNGQRHVRLMHPDKPLSGMEFDLTFEYDGFGADSQGLGVFVRSTYETFALQRAGTKLQVVHRSPQMKYQLQGQVLVANDNGISLRDNNGRCLKLAGSHQILSNIGGFHFRRGASLPRMHPAGQCGLVQVMWYGSNFPGFGLLELTKGFGRDLVSVAPPRHLTSNLPELTVRRLNHPVPHELGKSAKHFVVKEVDIRGQLESDGQPHVVATDGDYVWVSCRSSRYGQNEDLNSPNVVARLDTSQWTLDYVIEDVTWGGLTRNCLIVQSDERFVVIDRESLQPIRELDLESVAKFRTGFSGEICIVDRIEGISAAINAKTGRRVMHYTSRCAGSSPLQLSRCDHDFFDEPRMLRKSASPTEDISGHSEFSPDGKWIYTRFGLLKFESNLAYYTDFPGQLKGTLKGDWDSLWFGPGNQLFSRNSDFAFFWDSETFIHEHGEKVAKQKFHGMVQNLVEPNAPPIELVTDYPQDWIDMNPVTGHFWVRVRKNDKLELAEFDETGKRIGNYASFPNSLPGSSAPYRIQHMRFLTDGSLFCKTPAGFFVATRK
ncbi:MAG: hypothetical protein ACR2NP_05050 [Pirellulaceae bacterium]